MTFEEFVEQQLSDVVRMATAICGNVPDAEDLAHDVMIKAQRHWQRIAGLDVPMAYIRRMLVNEFISAGRKTSRVSPAAAVSLAQFVPDHAAAVTDRHALRAEISRLPRRQQAVLALRYYAGLADAEIAEELGCRPATVRSSASRALATLRVATTPRLTDVKGDAR